MHKSMLTRSSIFIPIVLLLVALTVPCYALEPGNGLHVIHYDLELSPDLANESVSGIETIVFRSEIQGLREITFTGNALTIDDAELGGKPIQHSIDHDLLSFSLPNALEQGEIGSLHIIYHGKPQKGITFTANSVYTSYDACDWMICFEDAPGDKAEFSLDLHVPKGMASIASGQLIVKTKNADGSEIHHWRNKRPYSPYLYDFAIGKYVVVKRLRHRAKLIYLSDIATKQELAQYFDKTGEMVKFLSEKAGVDLPSQSYAQLLVSGDEAQEAATYSIIGKDNIDAKDDWVLVHELAHQWWGNLVTCATWKDFWLNEGITVYMTAAWKEHQYGHDAYNAELNVARRRVAEVRKKGWDKPLAFDGEYPSMSDRRAVQYSKGALFMEHLRSVLGDEAFWEGLRSYTRAHAGGTVTSIDLERAMENASGRNLSDLFAEWVFGK